MIRPSNSGTATWVATSSGDRPSSLAAHCARDAGQAQALQDRARPARRAAPTSQASSSPPAPTRRRVRRRRRRARSTTSASARAAAFEQLGLGGAQRGAEHRQRPAARGLDRVAQRLDVRGVAGQVLGAVVEHGDGRAVVACGARAGPARPRSGVATGGAKPWPVSSTVSDRKACSWRRFSGAALRQVGVRLRATPAGHRGLLHQLGVGRLLAAERRRPGTPLASDRVEAVLPGAVAAEDPHHDHVGARRAARESSSTSRAGLAQR